VRPGWAQLGRGARLFRVGHGIWGAFNLAALVYIWLAALRRAKPGPKAGVAVGLLLAEGGALVIGRGDCPFGPLQARLGDPVPMFEWVLPPHAAKAAIPILAVVSVTGIAALAVRSRGIVIAPTMTRQ
jgi:hypothetical protein